MTGDAKFSRIPARATDLELTAADWRVLHVIGLYADKAGHACPSLDRIAKITRIAPDGGFAGVSGWVTAPQLSAGVPNGGNTSAVTS